MATTPEPSSTTATPVRDRPRFPGYGLDTTPDTGLISWPEVDGRLRFARNYWLSTASVTGRPHSSPVWGIWHNNRLYFSCGEQSVKARNLTTNPRVSLHLESGDSVVIVEGEVKVFRNADGGADGVTGLIDHLNRLYGDKYVDPQSGIPLQLSAQPDSPVFAIHPRKVLAWYETSFVTSVTRFRFP